MNVHVRTTYSSDYIGRANKIMSYTVHVRTKMSAKKGCEHVYELYVRVMSTPPYYIIHDIIGYVVYDIRGTMNEQVSVCSQVSVILKWYKLVDGPLL